MSSPTPAAAAPEAAAGTTPVVRRKLFWVALLYFSEGLPLGVFFDLFPVHFRQQGVNLADIGLLSLLGLAWTLKFLWAPAVDWARRHRYWICAANAGMAAVMLFFGSGGADGFGPWVWVAIGVFTVLSATNDIATDGYTIGLLDRREYGLANGVRIAFYRVGMLTAGALLVVAGRFGWSLAYLVGAGVFGCNALMALTAPAQATVEPREAGGVGLGAELRLLAGQPLWIAALALVFTGLLWPALGPLAKVMQWTTVAAWNGTWWMRGLVPVGLMMAGAAAMVLAARTPRAQALKRGPAFGAWVELLTRPGIVAILLFVLLFKLGDAAMGFMVKPFWVDAGFSSEQIGLVSVNVGLGLSIAGGLIGGWYTDTRGIYRGLWVLGIWQALSNLGYAAAAWALPAAVAGGPQGWDLPLASQAAVYTASALESFTGGLGTGAFLAFLMAITSRERATTEYAILSSIFAFTRAVAGFGGGIGAQEMGYAAYFFLTFWMSFPAYLLLPSVRRMLDAADPR